MGTLFFIIGALLKTHPPDPKAANPAQASKAMAGLLYIYVCFYSCGWGPIPWVYCSDIFPNRTRHYGLALASASQWLFSMLSRFSLTTWCSLANEHSLSFSNIDFVISKITPTMVTNLGYKVFITFATINILGGCVFALLIPETKNKSLEEMDVIFGSVSKEQRAADISRAQHRAYSVPVYLFSLRLCG